MLAQTIHHAAIDLPQSSGQSDWHVAYTQPKCEFQAVNNLANQAFETYFPKFKSLKRTPDGWVANSQAMFPRYIFFRPSRAEQSICSARSTRGVAFVLSFGFQVAAVKAQQIDAIKACELERNGMDTAEMLAFRPGAKVKFLRPCFGGVQGLVSSVAAHRVKVLLDLLGSTHEVEFAHHELELL